MSKKLSTTLSIIAMMAVVAFAAPAGLATAAPSADDIINKYIDAIGGKAALAKINNRVTKGVFALVDMGMTATYENYTQTPNFLNVISLDGMGEIRSGIKDDVAWESSFMQGDSILDGAKKLTAQRSATIEPLANWSKWYESAEADGEATVGDSPAYKVVLTPKEGGDPETYYFDQASGLIVQRDGVGQDGMMSSTMISDYREVDGVQVAHAIEILGGMTIEITFESIEQNVEIAADQFDLPTQIAALANPVEASEGDEGSDHK